jgi:hypothetical protein
MTKRKTDIKEVIEELEAEGFLQKTGKFKQARNGELQPEYEVTPFGKWLSGTGQLDKYLSASVDDPES